MKTKNKIKISIIFIAFAIFVFAGLRLAQSQELEDECFIQLNINEIMADNGNIQFNLQSLSNVYGIYQGLINLYDEKIGANYILNVYNSASQNIGRYSLYSARFLLWDGDDPDNPGGIIEEDSGIISATIPYNPDIKKIIIDNNGQMTDLNINSKRIKCMPWNWDWMKIIEGWLGGGDLKEMMIDLNEEYLEAYN